MKVKYRLLKIKVRVRNRCRKISDSLLARAKRGKGRYITS